VNKEEEVSKQEVPEVQEESKQEAVAQTKESLDIKSKDTP
jgi:hypothetical protein